jgi:hypothetical protein
MANAEASARLSVKCLHPTAPTTCSPTSGVDETHGSVHDELCLAQAHRAKILHNTEAICDLTLYPRALLALNLSGRKSVDTVGTRLKHNSTKTTWELAVRVVPTSVTWSWRPDSNRQQLAGTGLPDHTVKRPRVWVVPSVLNSIRRAVPAPHPSLPPT